MKSFVSAVILIVSSVVSAASAAGIDSDAGTKGFSFLKASPDAVSGALAGASVAASGMQGLSSANPAALSGMAGRQVSLSHAELFSSVNQNYLGAALPGWGGVINLAIRTQSSGDIPLRSEDPDLPWGGVPSENPAGTYGVHDAAFSIGYAREASGVHWGASVSYLYEKIYLYSATAVAVDAGVQMRKRDWAVGLAVRNLGLSRDMRSEDVPLPWDIRAGVEYGRSFGDYTFRALTDVRYAPDYHETVHGGVEFVIRNLLALRAGYRHGLYESTGSDGFTAGAGLRLGPMAVDYAFLPGPDGLDSRHTVALSIGNLTRRVRPHQE